MVAGVCLGKLVAVAGVMVVLRGETGEMRLRGSLV